MDVLLTVLKTVKLEGAMFYNAEFSAPWSFRAPPSGLVAPYLSPEPRHVIMYHLLTHGLKLARMGGGGEAAFRGGSELEASDGQLGSNPHACPVTGLTGD